MNCLVHIISFAFNIFKYTIIIIDSINSLFLYLDPIFL